MLSPQGRTGFMDGLERCALASASDAVAIPPCRLLNQRVVNYAEIERRFPILLRRTVHPTKPFAGPILVRDIVWSLNDSYDWTRFQIADWLESVERELATPADRLEAEVRS